MTDPSMPDTSVDPASQAPAAVTVTPATPATPPISGEAAPPAVATVAANSEVPNNSTPDPVAFVIPDKFKEKEWVKKFKTQDDLLQSYENLEAMIGQKGLVIPDAETATPEEIQKYIETSRPKSKDDYTFSDQSSPELKGAFGDIMFDAGLSKIQADKIVKGYNLLEAAQSSKESFDAAMKPRFGDDYQPKLDVLKRQLKEYVPATDADVVNKMPSQYAAVMFGMLDKVLAAHGIKDTGTGGDQPGGVPPAADLPTQQKQLRAEIRAIRARPHEAAELNTAINKLQATYEGKK